MARAEKLVLRHPALTITIAVLGNHLAAAEPSGEALQLRQTIPLLESVTPQPDEALRYE